MGMTATQPFITARHKGEASKATSIKTVVELSDGVASVTTTTAPPRPPLPSHRNSYSNATTDEDEWTTPVTMDSDREEKKEGFSSSSSGTTPFVKVPFSISTTSSS